MLEGNFSLLRKKMNEASPPMLPYFGVFLKDLELVEEGNENMLHGLINWYKMELLGQIVRQIRMAQKRPFVFRRLERLSSTVCFLPHPRFPHFSSNSFIVPYTDRAVQQRND